MRFQAGCDSSDNALELAVELERHGIKVALQARGYGWLVVAWPATRDEYRACCQAADRWHADHYWEKGVEHER